MKFIDKVIYKEIKPHRAHLLFVVILMLLIVGFEALSPWPYKFLIDNVLGNEPITSDSIGKILVKWLHAPIAIGFFVVFLYFMTEIFLSVFEYFKSLIMKKVIRDIVFDFSKAAFSNLEAFNIGFYRQQSIGDYIYRLSYDVNALGEYIEDGILPIITSSLYLIVTTIIMFLISVKLTLLSLVALPFLTIGLYLFNKKLDTATKYSERWNSSVFSYIDQALSQLRIIQAFTQEKKTGKKFSSKLHTSLESDIHMYKLNFLLNLVVGIIIALSYAIIIANGITDVHIGAITTGLLVVFIFYLDNLTSPILSIIFATSIIKQTHVKISRMHEFFADKSHLIDHGSITDIQKSGIYFHNVTLLSEHNEPILKNITFSLEENTLTVFIGVSGSGKSSIISLIPRLINDPSEGTIYIGEHDIKEYSVHSLRETISYTPQDIILFNDTIYNNIIFGNPAATRQDVINAAKLACAHEFIEKHPLKYNFMVGEGGNFLSGGQRQRILLARTFVKSAKIVILDEPLSFLDLKTRLEVWENIQEYAKGKTVIIVTNIMDVISKADQVIVINEGRIIHTGKHNELLKHPKYYNLLVKTG